VARSSLALCSAIWLLASCGGRSIDPGDADSTGTAGSESQASDEEGEAGEAESSADTETDAEATTTVSDDGDGVSSEAGSGDGDGDGDDGTSETSETDSGGDTSTTGSSTGGDGDGDGDSPLECGFWEDAMPGSLVITGSQASNSCLEPFDIEGYAMPGSTPYELIVDACPCDQDCAEPDPHTITRLDGGWIGEDYQGCIRISASAAPVECHSRLVTIHADENPCDLVAMSFDIGGTDYDALPEVILDDPELRIENLGPQMCESPMRASSQYLLEFTDPWLTEVHLAEGDIWANCDGGLNVHFGRITRNRITPGDGNSWGYISIWTGVGYILPP
jgi:hypothetical protein